MRMPFAASLLLTLCTPVALSQQVLPAAQAATPAVGAAVQGRFLVVYSGGAVPADAAARIGMAGGRVLAKQSHLGIVVASSGSNSPLATAAALAAQPGVARVVADRIVTGHALRGGVASGQTSGSQAISQTSNQGTGTYNATPIDSGSTPPVSAAGSTSAESWAVRAVGGFGSASTPGPWTTTQGAGVRIAILDSGIDAAHPDLAPNLAVNLSEIDQTALPSPCDDGSPQDQQGHGSWAASLAAGVGGVNGVGLGVAPAATLLNIKVLQRMPADGVSVSTCAAGEASGLMSWVLQGIDDAVARHADIISLSLGTLVDLSTGDGAGLKTTFDEATHAAANAGTLIVAAAGNDGLNLAGSRYIELPAMARDVLAVVASTNPACAENLQAGASCQAGPVTLPYYSNYGAPLKALAAPGGSYPDAAPTDPTAISGWIYAACSEGKPGTADGAPSDPAHSFGCFGLGHTAYVQAMGTSASAPLTAGAAALLRAVHPQWSPAELIAALRAAAIPVTGLPVPMVSVSSLLMPAASNVFQHQAQLGAR